MLQQQLWQQKKNIGCQFYDPKTEIGKVTEFHKKKSKRLDVIEEKLMGGANFIYFFGRREGDGMSKQ